jgi:hypothetical protein
MQVNLMYHPDAFRSLDQAFDPASNTRYAARFLNQLYAQTNDWKQAAALYHSATPQLGADYRRRVLAVWPEETRLQAEFARDKLAEAWAATLRLRPVATTPSPAPAEPSGIVTVTDLKAAGRPATASPRPTSRAMLRN